MFTDDVILKANFTNLVQPSFTNARYLTFICPHLRLSLGNASRESQRGALTLSIPLSDTCHGFLNQPPLLRRLDACALSRWVVTATCHSLCTWLIGARTRLISAILAMDKSQPGPFFLSVAGGVGGMEPSPASSVQIKG